MTFILVIGNILIVARVCYPGHSVCGSLVSYRGFFRGGENFEFFRGENLKVYSWSGSMRTWTASRGVIVTNSFYVETGRLS